MHTHITVYKVRQIKDLLALAHFSHSRSLLTVEFVQASQVIKERLQGLGNRKKLQKAVNDDVKDGQEAQAHVAKVDG